MNWIPRIILMSCVLVPALPVCAEVKVRLSHNPVQLHETFELTIESSGERGGAPDLSAIKQDFEVVDRTTSQSIRVVNGRASHKGELRLTLMPRRSGEVRIQPITVGDEQSEPILIKVLEPDPNQVTQSSDAVFLEVGTDRESALVQAQVIYTVRLYWKAQLADLKLSAPQTQGPYTVVEQLGDSREYRKTVNGMTYQVSELRYALFPQTPGALTIRPAELTAFETAPPQRPYDPFSYFSQPRAGKRIRVQSEALQLTVRPIPAKAPSKPWLPATNLQLAEAWPEADPEFRVGKPITRTLMVLADGLPAAKLPLLEPQYPEGLKTYTENATLENRPSPQGLTGVRQERTTLVPTREGSFTLPAIEIRWWSTRDRGTELAQLPSRRIRVLPALPETIAPTQPPAPPVQQQYPLMSPPPSSWSPAREPPSGPEPTPQAAAATPAEPASWSIWLPLLLAIGWIATAAAWWLSRRGAPAPSMARPIDQEAEAPPLSPGLRSFQEACQHSDGHAAQEALIAWGRENWPDQPITSLGALASLTPPDLAREIQALDRALYSSTPGSWDCRGLWEAVTRFHLPTSASATASGESLFPLNPNI